MPPRRNSVLNHENDIWFSLEAYDYVKYESTKLWYDFELNRNGIDQNINF